MGTLLIRADASTAIGSGHVMRCLALAQAWADAGGRAVFVMAETTRAVQNCVRSEGFELVSIDGPVGSGEDSDQTVAAAAKHSCEWVVIDGYQFGAEYQRSLKRAGRKVLLVDDHGKIGQYSADIVLDQNPFIPESAYLDRDPRCKLLLGLKYALLRREFTRWTEWKRSIQPVGGKILVTMGGSDPANLTARALEALADAEIEELEVTVVAGGSNPHARVLQEAVEGTRKRIRWQHDVASMPELMSGSDVAMIAGGGTLWEALFMGCAVLSYSSNSVQKNVIDNLHRAGAVVSLDGEQHASGAAHSRLLHEVVYSQECRERLSNRGREFVDGLGAGRVVSVLQGGSC